jgi:hypothetical protein
MFFVYCLTSTSADLYYDQLLISVTSLLFHNPAANIIVLVDAETEKTLQTGYRHKVYDLATVKSVKIDERFTKVQRSRWLKTKMRELVEGDIVYIDTDTIIAAPLTDFPDCKVGFVRDGNNRGVIESLKVSREVDAKQCGFHHDDYIFSTFMNGGFSVVRDTEAVHKFFKDWHSYWLKSLEINIARDQPALHEARYTNPNVATVLSDEWNMQIGPGINVSLQLFMNAKVIHMLAGAKKGNNPIPEGQLIDYTIWQRVKDSQGIPDDVLEILKSPKVHIRESLVFSCDSTTELIRHTEMYHFMLKLFEKHNKLYRIINAIFKIPLYIYIYQKDRSI